jgi:transcriptional regulator with XRE-family HTH domain
MVATNIKFLRRFSGLNQTEFGKLFKRNRGNVDSYERGVAKPPTALLVALAKHYGLTLEALTTVDLRKSPGLLFKSSSHKELHERKCADLLKAKDELIKEQRQTIDFLKKLIQKLTRNMAKNKDKNSL